MSMKKKGLIISTVVMVVVLIASLTTATYAWFSSSNNVYVEPISMNVGEGADLLIGAKTNNTYAETVSAGDFQNGTLTWESGQWSGENGLSTSINTGLAFTNLSKAIGTGTLAAEEWTVDSTFSEGNTIIIANGNGSEIENSTVETATANKDYFSIVMGVQPVASDLNSIACVVTAVPTGTRTTLDMAAAIHVRYRVDGGEWTELDIYGNDHWNTTKANVTLAEANKVDGLTKGSGVTVATGTQAVKFDVLKEAEATGKLATGDDQIHQFEIMVFIAGYDTQDCNNNSKQKDAGAQIYINFVTDKVGA